MLSCDGIEAGRFPYTWPTALRLERCGFTPQSAGTPGWNPGSLDGSGGRTERREMSVTDSDNATTRRTRRTHQRPRALPEPTLEGFLCFDPKGRCSFASESAGRMLGCELGELLGKDVRKFGCPACQDNGEETCAVHRTLQTGEVCRSDRAIFRRKDGTSLKVECTSQPIIEGDQGCGRDLRELGRARACRRGPIPLCRHPLCRHRRATTGR
jgi:PAS domain S-box-containing protein